MNPYQNDIKIAIVRKKYLVNKKIPYIKNYLQQIQHKQYLLP